MSVHQYRSMEAGNGDKVRQVNITPEKRELCFILRRRAKMTQKELGKAIGRCPFWVRQMEDGTRKCDELAEYWKI